LASGRRVELIDVLAQGERSVDDLANEIGQSVANTSHRLRAMARAGLLTTRRDGTRIYYALASERVVGELWSALRDVAAAQVANLERGDVVLLDVRPEAEFAAGHIAGARSVPVGEIRRQLRAIPKGAEVVAYCRGPYCVYADEAVRELTRRGFRAQRLIDGFPEWKRAGLPVAAGGGA
jgi:rhodanese-related sulfurtransferase